MAATVLETVLSPIAMMTSNNPKSSVRVCFSFAAYAMNLIDYLKSCNVPVEEGLTDAEFCSIESTFGFTFPPDLRSVLQEGLPVGSGFPNWRLFSIQQLQILTSLPILGLRKDIARHNFWLESWGERPVGDDEAVALANGFLKTAPVLVPIYRNFYIPSAPCLAGNPVFYVNGSDVKLMSFDISGFFQQVEFRNTDDVMKRPNNSSNYLFNAPAWAATEPRRIEFWTELVERGERLAASIGGVHWWWWSGELGGCLERVFWRLRDGGWKEEEVREMMMMMDDRDETELEDRDLDFHDKNMVIDREFVMWHLRLLSRKLLRAGWSSEDVVDSLGFPSDHHLDADSFRHPINKT